MMPLRPHLAHLAERRRTSLETSGPHRIINGIIAIAALCRQAGLVQWAHHQQLVRCSSCKVETGPSLRMLHMMAVFVAVTQPPSLVAWPRPCR